MRTTIVSTSKMKAFKNIYYVFIICGNMLFLGIILPLIIRQENYIQLLFLPILWYFSFRALQDLKNMKTVFYDESSVYYEKDGYEVQIPFEDIKNIELNKGWGINLYRPTQDGDRIRFTPSVWYPFNFRKKEEEINKLRDKIDRYKETLPEKNLEGLPGYRF
jgi:hypothetical protein